MFFNAFIHIPRILHQVIMFKKKDVKKESKAKDTSELVKGFDRDFRLFFKQKI